jgi:hypothetical protein
MPSLGERGQSGLAIVRQAIARSSDKPTKNRPLAALLHKSSWRAGGKCPRNPLLKSGSAAFEVELDCFLEFLRSAERDFLAGLDLNGFPSGRIAAHAGCAFSHL